MNRFRLLALVVLFVAAPAIAQPRGEKYAPKDGRFTIRFRGPPKESNKAVKSSIGELKVFTATYATSDSNVLMVSYTDFPEGAAKPEHRNTLFTGVRDGLAGKEGKVLDETDLEVGPDKVPGREFEIETDKGKKRIKIRVVLHDGRLYQIAAIGTESFVKAKDTKAFLDSFELTK